MSVFSHLQHPLHRVGTAVLSMAVSALLICQAAFPALAAETVLKLEPLEPENDAESLPSPETTWHLSADSLTALSNNAIIEASGSVILRQGADQLKADFARYFTETGWVFLRGNVHLVSRGDTIDAQDAEFDLRSQTGWLHNGQIFVADSHIYVRGNRIDKLEGNRYTFSQARITTCDGDIPAWSVKASEALVELDGYARLYHPRVAIRDIDFAYVPYLLLPAKTTRQTGLLLPEYGYSTARGFYYTQPFYWAVNDASDMTFYAGFMTKRGSEFGAEYRSMPYTHQKTWFIASGIRDSKTAVFRDNKSRYWLRGMADGYIGTSGWQYRANLDYVSDQDYLREFSSGFLGFNKSREVLYSAFGRDPNEDYQNRVSQALAFRDWDRFGLAVGIRYEQNPSLGHGGAKRSSDTLIQHFPDFNAFLYRGGIVPGIPLEAEAAFTSSYLYRRLGTSGMRTELFPQISLPLDLKYLSLIPSLGVRQTWYTSTHVDRSSAAMDYGTSETNPDLQGRSRTLPNIDVQAFTETSRIWQLSGTPVGAPGNSDTGFFSGWAGLRHNIQFRANYTHIRNEDQSENPFYGPDDRINTTNEITYSIINILTRKRGVVQKAARAQLPPLDGAEVKNAADTVNYDYLDLLRWKVEWGYDFKEAHRNQYLDTYPNRRPMMDIFSELSIQPSDWISYRNRLFISPYSGDISRQEHLLSWRISKYLSWSTGIDYRTKDYNFRNYLHTQDSRTFSFTTPMRKLVNRVVINPLPKWSLSLDDVRNLRAPGRWGRGYEKTYSIAYTDQCYRLIFQYKYDDYDKSYAFLFQIPGLFD